jgi:hypothetical protein
MPLELTCDDCGDEPRADVERLWTTYIAGYTTWSLPDGWQRKLRKGKTVYLCPDCQEKEGTP